MPKIQRALISVTDKTGIHELGRALVRFGVEILSTGGTARALADAGIKIREVSDFTGFPEMLDGRVKTLHPKIHGGILGIRSRPEHVRAMEEHGIVPIDLIAVNLYAFEKTVARPDCTLAEAIENIDIGGPTLLRAAAKRTTRLSRSLLILRIILRSCMKWINPRDKCRKQQTLSLRRRSLGSPTSYRRRDYALLGRSGYVLN